MSDRLRRLADEFGQSPWLDNLKRSYVTSGHLDRLVEQGVRGLTSNPTIFQKAIQGSADYDEQYRQLVAANGLVIDDYWAMVLQDIHGALDAFAPVHARTDGLDGYVSVEVAPDLAHHTQGTIAAARQLHASIDRPNLMVKIPATAEGIPAIEQIIADGKSVNVTLIFSLDRYDEVIEAYLRGLERCAADGGALGDIASVASFFISRVDTEIDRRLESIGTDDALALRGTGAVAQGKLAYELFRRRFSGERWDALVARGARVQRPLWASTSTKNPAYPDTLYVDELIGPDTVNTLPENTLEAFADHGTLARTIDRDLEVARANWQAIGATGVDLDDVAAQLEREGVSSFQKSFDELLGALSDKAAELRG
jgi:transaldolase